MGNTTPGTRSTRPIWKLHWKYTSHSEPLTLREYIQTTPAQLHTCLFTFHKTSYPINELNWQTTHNNVSNACVSRKRYMKCQTWNHRCRCLRGLSHHVGGTHEDCVLFAIRQSREGHLQWIGSIDVMRRATGDHWHRVIQDYKTLHNRKYDSANVQDLHRRRPRISWHRHEPDVNTHHTVHQFH